MLLEKKSAFAGKFSTSAGFYRQGWLYELCKISILLEAQNN